MDEAPDPRPRDPIAEAADLWARHGWGDAAPGMAAVTSLMRAHQLVLARVEGVLKPFDISFARYELLMLLLFSRRGSLPMRTISERLQVHQTSVTSAVDRLEAAGLVERRPHPTDRRATVVHLTQSGRLTAREATDALNSQVFVEPGLSPASVQVLVEVLAELRKRAGDF